MGSTGSDTWTAEDIYCLLQTTILTLTSKFPIDISAPGSDWADSSATSDRPGQDWGCPQAYPLWDWWFPILFSFPYGWKLLILY